MYAGPLLSYGLGSFLFARQEQLQGVRSIVPAMLAFTATTVVVSFMHINLFSFSEFADLLWLGWFILATVMLALLTVRVTRARSSL